MPRNKKDEPNRQNPAKANGDGGVNTKKDPNDAAEPGTKDGQSTKKKMWVHSQLGSMMHYVIGRPNRTIQWQQAHHFMLQLPVQPNVIRKDTLFSHFVTTRPFYAGFPVPLYVTPGHGPTVPDLMVRSLHVKESYQRELLAVHRKYRSSAANHTLPVGDGVQHTAALIYAALSDRDPDPYMEPSVGYDYHFTGGALATVGQADGEGRTFTVLKAVGKSLEDVEVLRIGPSPSSPEELEVMEKQHHPTDIPGPILTIVASESGRMVLVRKRSIVIVYRAVNTRTDCPEWEQVQQIFSFIPFASACFFEPTPKEGPPGIAHVLTTDFRRTLQLWTIDDGPEVSSEDVVKLPSKHLRPPKEERKLTARKEDNWTAVKSLGDRSLVACLDRRKLHLYAVERTGPEDDDGSGTGATGGLQLVYRGGSDFSQWTYDCERCCALDVCPSEGLVFVATCHKLVVARVVDGSPATSDKTRPPVEVVLVFTHNLRQRPVFISHQWHAGSGATQQHFVLLGSHLPMSYGIVNFTKSSTTGTAGGTESPYSARHYPHHPRKFHDGYREAQRRGHCLTAYEPLRRRFYACQSGATLVRRRPAVNAAGELTLHIVLQTSAGDLLGQRVSFHEGRKEPRKDAVFVEHENRSVAETLHHWHDRLVSKAGRMPYRATNFRTMKKFRDVFNCPHEPSELKRLVYLPPEVKKHRKGRRRSEEADGPEADSSSTEEDAPLSCPGAKRGKNARIRSRATEPLPWRQTMDELQQYRDVLAPTMLEVWRVGGNTGSIRTEQIPTKLPPLADYNERIGNWMDATNNGFPEVDVPPSGEIKIEDDRLSTGSAGNRGDDSEPASKRIKLEDDAIPCSEELMFASQQASSQPLVKNRPAKKVYMKGF